MLLVWIVLAFEVILLISNYMQFSLLDGVADGKEITMDEATANDGRVQFISLVYLLVFIASGITFIMWFRRAYFNLGQKVNHLSQTDGWAAGAWFVPFINLYRPYQMMKELYIETKEYLIKTGATVSEKFTTGSLGIWWTLWIISGIIGQVVFRLSMRAETIDEMLFMTTLEMAENIIAIPLAIVTVKMIKDYSDVEELLQDKQEINLLRERA
ncbi:DUF4328 domain-containing protein [Labilibacter sediminis]|nr:DUF4328 domain-containing protein [Labilibacter sediminis]